MTGCFLHFWATKIIKIRNTLKTENLFFSFLAVNIYWDHENAFF